MEYQVIIKPRAKKDLRKLDRSTQAQLLNAIAKMQDNLTGDVKRLTNFTPEYRLRSGSYRVLFEIENDNDIVIYRIRHRRDAYKG